jgi:hypothetical protein
MGRGAGFRDFLRLPSAKENRSNRRTLPISSHKVDLSNFGEVRNAGPAHLCRPFPLSRVIPAEAQRVEGSAVPCPQENAGMLVPSAPAKDHDHSPLCHLDRSSEGAKWRDLRCPAPKRMPACLFPQPPLRTMTPLPFVISTGAPKERSGEICGSSGSQQQLAHDPRPCQHLDARHCRAASRAVRREVCYSWKTADLSTTLLRSSGRDDKGESRRGP